MKINKSNNRITIVTTDHDIVISSVTVFGKEAYAVAISGHRVCYFDTVSGAFSMVTNYLSSSENSDLLDYLISGPKEKKIEVC